LLYLLCCHVWTGSFTLALGVETETEWLCIET
jgi:hypothetical protein